MDTDIFISYRREDEPGFVRRLYDFLKNAFPHHTVFMDVEAIPPGDRFQGHIVSRIVKCSAFIPIIGQKWLYPTGASSSRLFETNDMVRREIEAAIVCKCAIFPILVNDTPMPGVDDIPRLISGLCALNAIQINDASFQADAKPLVQALRRVIKHHIETHFTVAEFEAIEIGEELGADIFNRISKGINVTFEKIFEPMVERFMTEIEPVILRRDGEAMRNMVAAFKDEVIRRGWEMIGIFINFVCEDMPELKISPNEPHNPLYVAIEEHMRKEMLALSNVMMDQVAVTTANRIYNSGWEFMPDETGKIPEGL